jgi:hypothetical protein
MKCPKCGETNSDNWPIEIDGIIKDGGCQECWENECNEKWWKAVTDEKIFKPDKTK